jgi:hypothetical protein
MFFRVYFILRFICNISYYKSTRSNRITKLYGEDNTFQFSIKALFNKYSALFITFLSILSIFVFSFVLRMFERAFYSRRNSELIKLNYWEYRRRIEPSLKENKNHLADYYNSVWCVFTTLMNIGYGDFYPKTHFGRITVTILVLFGALLNALIVVSFLKSFEFSSNENKVFTLLERMSYRDKLEEMQYRISKAMVKQISIVFRLGRLNEKLKKENQLRKSVMEKLEEKSDDDNEELTKDDKYGLMSDNEYKKLIEEIKQFNILKEKNNILLTKEINVKRRIQK